MPFLTFPMRAHTQTDTDTHTHTHTTYTHTLTRAHTDTAAKPPLKSGALGASKAAVVAGRFY